MSCEIILVLALAVAIYVIVVQRRISLQLKGIAARNRDLIDALKGLIETNDKTIRLVVDSMEYLIERDNAYQNPGGHERDTNLPPRHGDHLDERQDQQYHKQDSND